MKRTTRSRNQDRSRVSSEKHEISYAAKRSGKSAANVRRVKKRLGRKTSRKAVMAKQ